MSAHNGTGDGLTEKQKAFISEYLIDLNATQAATRAGYSPNTAYSIGQENLTKPEIATAIRKALEARATRTENKADRVIQELRGAAFADIGEIFDFSGEELCMRAPKDIPEHARRNIASIRVKRYLEGKGADKKPVEVMELKLVDKLGALEKLGRHLALWKGDGAIVNVTTPDTTTKEDIFARIDRYEKFYLELANKGIGKPEIADFLMDEADRLEQEEAKRNKAA